MNGRQSLHMWFHRQFNQQANVSKARLSNEGRGDKSASRGWIIQVIESSPSLTASSMMKRCLHVLLIVESETDEFDDYSQRFEGAIEADQVELRLISLFSSRSFVSFRLFPFVRMMSLDLLRLALSMIILCQLKISVCREK
jgi:hypothetical protein